MTRKRDLDLRQRAAEVLALALVAVLRGGDGGSGEWEPAWAKRLEAQMSALTDALVELGAATDEVIGELDALADKVAAMDDTDAAAQEIRDISQRLRDAQPDAPADSGAGDTGAGDAGAGDTGSGEAGTGTADTGTTDTMTDPGAPDFGGGEGDQPPA